MTSILTGIDEGSRGVLVLGNGGLRLVPAGEALKTLGDDYARMVADGLLLDDAQSFDALMARCADIVERANRSVQK